MLFHAVAALLLACSLSAAAQAGELVVEQAWARATVAGQKSGGTYLTLNNGGAADRLLGASSAVAEKVELHSMTMDGDVMRMRKVAGLDVPPGRSVALQPGGYHLMLIGLKRPLEDGTRIPLTLKFAKAGEKQVQVEVRKSAPAGSADPHEGHGGHHGHHKH